MPLNKKTEASLGQSSLIREMFEAGIKLKAKFGADKVYDFSLGNPDLPPPDSFQQKLLEVVKENKIGLHSYMPNAGWPLVREKVAAFLKKEQNQDFSANEIIMTVGAGGGLNTSLKAILEPGDEVITPRPYFLEYGSYVDNFSGQLVGVESNDDFSLNLEALEKAINPKTRVILINSPHNPTGVVYSENELDKLAIILEKATKKHKRPIILLSDEPYRKIVYDNLTVPTVFRSYPYVLAVTSYSKDLSIPGERLGFIAVHPAMAEKESLIAGLILSNRILGYVNAPSLMQQVVAEIQGASVDISIYQKRRDIFVKGLQEIGYKLNIPKGAFYLFPQSPLADDKAFVKLLQEENVLGVPGSAFAAPGYFRLCYCVPETTIINSLPGFKKAFQKAS